MVYDEANRISSAAETSGGIDYYGYSGDNKRFYKYTSAGTEQLTFYGARGEKLGVYTITNSMGLALCPSATNIWFAGKLILESNQATLQDRLGTNRSGFISAGAPYISTTSERFYPYGDEITSTLNDHEKFATYTRDSYTGFDYADQRYYASTYGRFLTADPYQHGANGSNNPKDPGSWNRYAYVEDDPVNAFDPLGLFELQAQLGPVTDSCSAAMNPFSGMFQCLEAYFGYVGSVQAASVPPNKGGYYTSPGNAAKTAWQYLNSNWSNCLSDFSQDARFNAAAFQQLLNGGITWVSDRNGVLNDVSINQVAHNGDLSPIGSLFTGGADAATIPGTHTVILGPDYFTNETQTQQIAVMIHEALHVALGFNDSQLAGWLQNFGFTPSSPFVSGQITNWIVGTANQMDTNGGCPKSQ